MINFQKKYIITGAPGTGKTTVLNLLKETILCMEEVSRKVIIDEQKSKGNGMPWSNINRFSELVFKHTKQELLNTNTLICDRSLLDLEAYLSVENKIIPDYLRSFPYHKTYQKTVFFAPTWLDIYSKDVQRLQEFEHCLKIEKALLHHYKEKEFDIIMLPKSTPLERKKLILNSIF